MIKLIGTMMIGSVCVWLGFSMSDKLKKRKNFLDAFITSLTALETEIEFGKYELRTIFKRLDKDGLCGFYGICCDNMAENGIRASWKKASLAAVERAYINIDDMEAIYVLGAELGKTDVEGQKKNIERVREMLIPCAENAADEYKRLGKVYKSCGVLAAVFIIIVML